MYVANDYNDIDVDGESLYAIGGLFADYILVVAVCIFCALNVLIILLARCLMSRIGSIYLYNYNHQPLQSEHVWIIAIVCVTVYWFLYGSCYIELWMFYFRTLGCNTNIYSTSCRLSQTGLSCHDLDT